MLTIEGLNSFGANTAEGLGRCYQNEALYLRLVKMIPAEQNFDKLKNSLEQNDLDTAFEAAHALKGVTGNVSLTPLYEALSDITERLRVKEDADYPTLLKAVLEQRDAFAALCED